MEFACEVSEGAVESEAGYGTTHLGVSDGRAITWKVALKVRIRDCDEKKNLQTV